MKQKAKQVLKKMLTPLVKRLGLNETIVEKEADQAENLYNILGQFKFVPLHVVDVGANHGNWTRKALQYFPNAYFTLLEPQYWLKDSIKDILEANNKVTFNAVGAGSQKGSFKFTVVNRDDSSSFRFTAEEANAFGFRQIDMPVVTLNDFIRQSGLPVPDIIKIDAEGLDLEVMKGASDFIGITEIFLIEAAVGLKDVQNSFLNVMNHMNENGYRLFEITELNRPFQPPVLWLTELVFIKKNGWIDNKTNEMVVVV